MPRHDPAEAIAAQFALARQTADAQMASHEHAADIRFQNIQDEIDRRLASFQREVEQRFLDGKEQTATTGAALERRLDGMNEFRLQISDQAARMVSRDMFEAAQDSIDRRINADRSNWERLLAQATDAVKDRVDKLEAEADKSRGKSGANAQLVAIISLVIAVISVIILFLKLK
jgi:hypothetical protein